MSTRARIGIMQKSGRIIASYQHWDGYPGGLGYKLCEHWEDSKKVTDAIKLGDASKWGYIVGKKIDFDKVKYGSDDDLQNCYYGRDRGEKNAGYRVYKDTGDKDFLGKPKFTWYYSASTYVDKPDGGYKESISDFKPLERYAILEHIDILKRTMEMEDERKVA
jgi:hypothetical protein